MRLKVEQIETKIQVLGRGGGEGRRGEPRGWGRGPGMVKRKAKGTKRGLKGPEQPANPDEGTIAEVW